MKFNHTCKLLFAVCAIGAAANASTIFNFDGDSLGTSTTFTDTVGGLSATFSSPGDPGGFVIYPTIFDTLTGNVLGDPGPAGLDDLSLTIAFSQDLSAVSLDFATSDFNTASPITLTAYQNSQMIGSMLAMGTVPDGFFFPEGQIGFSSGAFNRIVISTTAPDFAVDNIAAIATPEPALFPLLGLGLIAIAFCSWRAKSRSSRSRSKMSAAALTLAAAGLAPAQTTQSIFPLLPPVVSTVPSNGDVNPYGVVFAPKTVWAGGALQPGDILVSNFNNNQNLQGTGTTIVRISKGGAMSTFYSNPSRPGLSAALGVLSDGVVLAGNLPTADGTSVTAQPGSLAVIGPQGDFLGTFGTLSTVDGPWGMAVYDTGTGVTGTAHVFLSNVLSGAISRFDINYTATAISATATVVASGFNHRADPAALEVGPSGLAYDAVHNTLLVASSYDNAIYEIPNAATSNSPQAATLLVQDSTHLHGPIDIVILPNGHLVVANSDGSNADPNQPSELVEFTAAGAFVGQMSIDPNNGGAFGVATNTIGWGTIQLAAVDDNANTLKIWTTVVP
jgi:hypothetical protein